MAARRLPVPVALPAHRPLETCAPQQSRLSADHSPCPATGRYHLHRLHRRRRDTPPPLLHFHGAAECRAARGMALSQEAYGDPSLRLTPLINFAHRSAQPRFTSDWLGVRGGGGGVVGPGGGGGGGGGVGGGGGGFFIREHMDGGLTPGRYRSTQGDEWAFASMAAALCVGTAASEWCTVGARANSEYTHTTTMYTFICTRM